MPTIKLEEIPGRSLVAARRVPYKRWPVDADEPLGYFEPGDFVGMVYSYIDIDPPRNTKLYWQFLTSQGTAYHVPHDNENFDLQHLLNQGVLTSAQRREVQRLADQRIDQWLLEQGGNVVTAGGQLLKQNFGRIVTFAGIGIIAFFGIKALK
jgi:hypothetical protein